MACAEHGLCWNSASMRAGTSWSHGLSKRSPEVVTGRPTFAPATPPCTPPTSCSRACSDTSAATSGPTSHPALTAQNLDPGYEFLRALRSLELETFDQLVEQEQAHRWVTRILAHGGIPRSCLQPLLELLTKEIAAGAVDAAELLASWRVHNARLAGLHQPTRRFLLYGGQPSVDLLDRCLELMRERRSDRAMPSAQESGLPQYLVDAIAALRPDRIRRPGTGRGLAVPRPVVRLDPYSGLGPTIVLPAVASELADGSWRVDAGAALSRYEPSALTDTPMRLSPARSYSVEFVSSDGERRLFTFEALGRLPVLLLDPDTERLLRDPTMLAADEAWVLSPPGMELRARRSDSSEPVELRHIQDLPEPAGAWAGWSLRAPGPRRTSEASSWSATTRSSAGSR